MQLCAQPCLPININELRCSVVKPCLTSLGDYSPAAEDLLVGTAVVETLSRFHNDAPLGGLGVYRITPERHKAIWDEFLVNYPDLASYVRGLASQQQFLQEPHGELVTNLGYATAIAWLIYRSAGVNAAELQPSKDVNSAHRLAHAWVQHFDNGTNSTRNVEDFLREYEDCARAPDCRKLVA